MRSLLHDFRLAWRGLLHRPWLGLAAVLTCGAGIGLNAAVFSVVDRVLARVRALSHASYPHRRRDRFRSQHVSL
jgi:hypothetical protein